MTSLTYGSEYIYYLVSSSGTLSGYVADGGYGDDWAVVAGDGGLPVWFEPVASPDRSGVPVNAGDSVYICAPGPHDVSRYLQKRPVGESMKWDLVGGDYFSVNAEGVEPGQPVPVGANVTFQITGEPTSYVGLGTDDYVAVTGTPVVFVPTMTS